MVYFISGIDTGIGKTIVTGLMAKSLSDVITLKLVQTGNTGHSEDIDKHREIMACRPFPEDREGLTAPQIFQFPSSPHLAAALEHRSVDVEAIRRAALELAKRYTTVLVEGAGGLAVPLTEALLTIDFAAAEGWPLILVTCGRLGSLNHTILSLEAVERRGMKLAGVVYNFDPDADSLIDDDTPRMIEKYLARHFPGTPLVRIPDVGKPYPKLDFSAIFGRAL